MNKNHTNILNKLGQSSRLLIQILLIALMLLLTISTPAHAGNNGGNALDFDGINDHVDATNNGGASRTAASLGLPTNAITVEAWVYPRASGNFIGIANFIYDEGAAEYGWHLGLGTGTTGNTLFRFAVAGGGSGLTYLATTNYPLNRWYHVVGVYDGATMEIYVNGVRAATSTAQNGPIAYQNSWLTLGAWHDPSNWLYFNGMIDEIRIWDYARTETQLQSSMFGEISGATAGLVAYWQFNEGTGTTTADATGNALHQGTLTNMDPASDWIPSTAPLGDATVNAQTNVVGFWAAVNPASSGGLTISNNNFLNDIGDDVIFGHNNINGKTSADVPTTGAWASAPAPMRWNRTWYCDLNDQNSNGGTIDITFGLSSGGDAPVPPASNYRLIERAGTSGQFTDLGGATTVNTGSRTITFSGVSVSTVCSYITLGTLDDTNSPTAVTLGGLTARTNADITTIILLLGLFSIIVSGAMLILQKRHA